MLLKTLAEFGAAQERNARIVLDFIGRGDLSTRHALLNHGRRQVGTRSVNGGSIARGASTDNRNINRLIGSHGISSRRYIDVLCAHTQIYVNMTLMHYNN